MFEDSELSEILNNLANDPAKYRSKKDKKHQRSSFRDILKTIVHGGDYDTQIIKFGTESLYLDNWLRRKQYEFFKELIGPSMNIHLQENEFIRDIFELGPPVVQSDASKNARNLPMTSKEKALFNKEQFRHRTKAMNKKRETKDVTSGGGDVDDF